MGVPILSFFTGGGFLDMGFARAGFTTVWTNENNSVFADMYEFAVPPLSKELRNKKLLERISDRRSVDSIKADEIISAAFPAGRPELFGIIGGPPCPDFSNGGKQRGHKGDHGRLSKTFVDHICAIKPSFFVFENVHGLLRTEKHRAFFETLKKQLEDARYCTDRAVLNSLDFGLAQDRDRVFVIGIKKDLLKLTLGKDMAISDKTWFPWPVGKYHGARQLYDWPKINQNGKAPEKPEGIPEALMVYNLLSDMPEGLANSKEGFKPYSHKFKTVREGDTSGKSFKRLHRYRYSPTACYGNNEVHLHPWEHRRLTVREAMRIQGIPDAYALPEAVPLSSKFKLVANGVPVPLAEQIAFSLKKFLNPVVGRMKTLGCS
ncbi:MAG: DNA cytosine methyltransferase [Nitrospirae bacterium]|nr:DNA cytosine methyltransferase [Nitrospirota bacterium]